MNQSDFVGLRTKAIDRTPYPVSRAVLTCMPGLIWHPGPHPQQEADYYQDFLFPGSICCTADEAVILHQAAMWSNPRYVLEIGSYVGWSTAHLALGAKSALIVAVDSLEEHEAAAALTDVFYSNIQRCGVAQRVFLVTGRSPEILGYLEPHKGWDLAFVDGFHRNGQPVKDVAGLLPFMAENGVIILHDTWMPGVRDACNFLEQAGYQRVTFDTPAQLAFFYETEPRWWTPFMAITGAATVAP